MARFENAINIVLENEGGLVNNPSDPGGITNFGISLEFYKTIKVGAAPEDIIGLTQAMAMQIYRSCFWDKNKYNLIADQFIATKVFDLSVNMGAKNANLCLQRAAKAAQMRPIVEDGVIGTQSLYAINSSPPTCVYAALKSEAAGYYRNLAHANPKLEIFLKGWLNRAYSNV